MTLVRDTHSSNINFRGNPGRSSEERTSETLQIRYGLGSDWHIGLGIPYVSRSSSNTDFTSPPVHYSNTTGKGEQNPSIWATYGIINDKVSPLSLNAQLLISPDTTGDVATSYVGRLTAGWRNSDRLSLYARLSATTFEDSSSRDRYSFSTGAYFALSESLTLVPQAAYVHYVSTNTMSSFDQVDVGLSAHVKLTPNSYLIPGVVFYRNGASSSNDGLFHREATDNGKAFSLGFYHLF